MLGERIIVRAQPAHPQCSPHAMSLLLTSFAGSLPASRLSSSWRLSPAAPGRPGGGVTAPAPIAAQRSGRFCRRSMTPTPAPRSGAAATSRAAGRSRSIASSAPCAIPRRTRPTSCRFRACAARTGVPDGSGSTAPWTAWRSFRRSTWSRSATTTGSPTATTGSPPPGWRGAVDDRRRRHSARAAGRDPARAGQARCQQLSSARRDAAGGSGRQLAHGRAAQRVGRASLARTSSATTMRARDRPPSAALARSGPVRRARRAADPHPRHLRRAGPVARLRRNARRARHDRPDHWRRRPPARVPLLRDRCVPRAAALRPRQPRRGVGVGPHRARPCCREPMPDARLVEEAGLRLIGFSGSPIYNGRGMQVSAPRDVGEGVRWPGCARTRARPVIVVSHAPPRDVNDDDDLAHRGFTAFRWLNNRLAPPLWLHGHTALVRRGLDAAVRLVRRHALLQLHRRDAHRARAAQRRWMSRSRSAGPRSAACLLVLAGLTVALLVRPAIFSFAAPRDDTAVTVAHRSRGRERAGPARAAAHALVRLGGRARCR